METLRRALLPVVRNKTCTQVRFFRGDIRFPIPAETLSRELDGQTVIDITRRGKYLLLHTRNGAMVWHLGMSGRVIQHPSMEPVEKHTHAAFQFGPGTHLHFIDPRRFGCIVWAPKAQGHKLLNGLGLDPLDDATTPEALKTLARNCKAPVKSFLMDAKRLVGVGNIYACESLFLARIKPWRKAGRLTLADWDRLLASLREALTNSIASGGTTLRDFFTTDGTPGYYAVALSVYGKEGAPCPACTAPIARAVHSGRSTFYCAVCQKK